jgi:multisubunit Na+/H+ antiporter MnhE subunit
VGIVLVIIGIIVTNLFKFIHNNNLPDVCKNWNKNYIMEINLFLIGFIAHMLFEMIGANKWYCSNGYACRS